MKIKSNHINLFLVLISSTIIFIKYVELIQITEKKDTIIRSLEYKKIRLVNSVRACNIISEIKNRSPRYDDQNNRVLTKSTEKYWNLKSDIDKLNYKLMILSSHTSMVLDNYRLFKDEISNNVYLGMFALPLILCDAHSIQINKEKIPYSRFINFHVSMKNDIKIEYHRYTLNYVNGKIDTAKTIRYIDLKTLYNIR